MVGDTTLKRVTLVSGKGALGTWRSQAGQRRVSEEPVFSDEPEGKREMSGVDASQRLSFLVFRKAFRGKPGSERYSGNPTVADRRGACGNVDDGKSRAPQFYPDPSKCRSESIAPRPATGSQGSEAGLNGGHLEASIRVSRLAGIYGQRK